MLTIQCIIELLIGYIHRFIVYNNYKSMVIFKK